jgi:RNA polymerase sigma-70 factor (ECF subfamily)
LTEELLIEKCKLGHRDAQESLYKKFSSKLYGICLKYSKNSAEAEDNLHDSFMIIFDKIHQFKNKGSFEGWLKRITINTILQKYRNQTPLYSYEIPENIEDSEDYVSDEDIPIAVLLKHVQELPPKYRITFNMYVLDGYTHKEISKALGTSEGTSKSNLARAKSILKHKLKNSTLNIT